MIYQWKYETPDSFSDMVMNSDGEYLTGLRFEGSRGTSGYIAEYEEKKLPVFEETIRWLDIYFSGQKPDFLPKLHLIGTDFQREVWDILLEIPYGQTVTYGEIARKIADKRGLKTMSAQAVGGAVGHNRISVIVPCHRVIGSDGSLTGYAGGIERKIRLLDIEQPDFIRTIPKF